MAARLLQGERLAWRTVTVSRWRSWSSCADSSSSKGNLSADLPALDISRPIVMVWGANTNVGKTIISAGLSISLLCSGSSSLYLKPLQTGFPDDSDSRFVVDKVRHTLPPLSGQSLRKVLVSHSIRHVSPSVLSNAGCKPKHGAYPHLATSLTRKDKFYSDEKFLVEANCNLDGFKRLPDTSQVDKDRRNGSFSSIFEASTLWSWFHAVSPHITSAKEGLSVADSTILQEVASSIAAFSKAAAQLQVGKNEPNSWTVIESAGGVASPGPSGTLQCDLYRPFRLPSLLVGDGKLGGISSTITAYESLISRGYDVDAIVLIDHNLGNEAQLRNYLLHRLPIIAFPSIPEDLNDDLIAWFKSTPSLFNQLQDYLKAAHTKRLSQLRDMKKKAGQNLWWPFTQHSLVPDDEITVIDARVGDNFMIYKNDVSDLILQQFDACASWWTQGPDLKLQLELARQLAYAVGRFGHVMLPENVYEPALQCAESVLKLIGKGWASRVYYSDNGSTAVEIAIKMAFRKYLHDHQLLMKNGSNGTTFNLKVLALKDSYHGDTLGAQEAQAPNPYTGFLQQPWYQGRGLFLDPPYIFMRNRMWHVDLPESYIESKHDAALSRNLLFQSRTDLFNKQREHSELATLYSDFIKKRINSCKNDTTHLAALIIEPVIHGAAGMALVDPLFQSLLVKECKAQKIPVIFDEVFSGCWRLGVQSCAEYLRCTPDIGCYSKLLTGGVIPLAVTLASADVFDSFKGDSKLLALLHGHSYSGHAAGCQAAVTSLHWLSDPERNPNLVSSTMRLVEFWDPDYVAELSAHPEVHRVISLGTVFALELKAKSSERGYGSKISRRIVKDLRNNGIYNRPLGNVIYFMCGPTTSPQVCAELLAQLSHQLDEFAAEKQTLAISSCA